MDTKQAGDTTHQTSEGSTSSIDSVQEFSSTKKSYASERAKPGLPSGNAMKLARGLGWFSIGLGLTELLCPKVIASISGVSKQRTGLIRLYGLREITSGIAIFTQQKPTEALWSRVAGDAMDLASLGLAFTSSDAKRGRLAFATANVLAVTALDIMCAQQLSNDNKGIHAQATCIVNQPPEQVYQFWRDFQNLGRFMTHLESVEDLGNGRSHWTAKAPAGTTVEWDATLIADVPGEVITWRSLEGSDVDNAGAVRFERATGGRGTIVKVNLEYNPPMGVVGATVAKIFGEEPEQQLDDDLRRFKQMLEVGEVVVSEATLLGTGYTTQRPGRPASADELESVETPPSETSTNYQFNEGRMSQL